MGAALVLKETAIENKGTCESSEGKVAEAHQRQSERKLVRVKTRRSKTKQKAIQEGSKRSVKRIEKKVRTLKKLIPDTDSKDLEELFRDTAEYIMSLQMRVRVMQIIVDALSSSH